MPTLYVEAVLDFLYALCKSGGESGGLSGGGGVSSSGGLSGGGGGLTSSVAGGVSRGGGGLSGGLATGGLNRGGLSSSSASGGQDLLLLPLLLPQAQGPGVQCLVSLLALTLGDERICNPHIQETLLQVCVCCGRGSPCCTFMVEGVRL